MADATPDARTYTATIAHVYNLTKKRVHSQSSSKRPESPTIVYEKHILVRTIEIAGLDPSQQPASDQELDVYFINEVAASPSYT